MKELEDSIQLLNAEENKVKGWATRQQLILKMIKMAQDKMVISKSTGTLIAGLMDISRAWAEDGSNENA